MIAKLDRLSRDAHFLLGLQKAGVRFVAADMPEANELLVGILAVVAQAERKMISDRTQLMKRGAPAGEARLHRSRDFGIGYRTLARATPDDGRGHDMIHVPQRLPIAESGVRRTLGAPQQISPVRVACPKKGDAFEWRKAWAESSPASRRLAVGETPFTWDTVMSLPTMLNRVRAALADPSLNHRPTMSEWDEVAQHAVVIYEWLSGRAAPLTVRTDDDLSRPEVHEFMLEISEVVGFDLVTKDGARRLARAIKHNRARRPENTKP